MLTIYFPRITKEDIRPYSAKILVSLFDLIAKSGTTPEKLAENDYLMKGKPTPLDTRMGR
jgi:hypothetical protein